MAFMNFITFFSSVFLQAYALICVVPLTENPDTSFGDSTIQVPVGGNTWADNVTGRSRLITNAGIENWTNAATGFTTYIRINTPGSLKIRLKAKTDGLSQVRLKIKGKEKK